MSKCLLAICPQGQRTLQQGQDTVRACESCPTSSVASSSIVVGSGCNSGKYLCGEKCNSCEMGRFNSGSTQICDQCTIGTYSTSLGSSSCTDCPNGKTTIYRGSTGPNDCQDCETVPGTNPLKDICCFRAVGSGPSADCPAVENTFFCSKSACRTCPSGKISVAPGSEECISCALGQYINGAQCTQSSEGTFGDGFVQALCAPGKFSNVLGAAECSSCQTGKYSKVSGATQCLFCLPGKYSKESSATTCLSCESGQYSEVQGAASCTKCSTGKTMLNSAGFHNSSNECTNCTIGKYSPFLGFSFACFPCSSVVVDGAAECVGCSSGFYEKYLGSGCVRCPSGKYTNKRNLLGCLTCPSGWFTKDIPFVLCVSCPRGTYGATEGGASQTLACSNCLQGRYSEIDGLAATIADIACQACPSGRWSSKTAASKDIDCLNCKAGRWGNNPGSHSEQNACINCKKGRYGTVAGHAGEQACQACPSGYAQASTGQTLCIACSPGFTNGEESSAACQACEIGKFMRDSSSKLFNCLVSPAGSFVAEGSATILQVRNGWYAYNCLSKQENGTFGGCTDAQPCASGTFGGTNAQPCTSCPGGYTSSPGMTFCSVCEPGKFATTKSSASCTLCTIGRYQQNTGATTCIACSLGRSTTQEGAMLCDLELTDAHVAAPLITSLCPTTNEGQAMHVEINVGASINLQKLHIITIETSNSNDFSQLIGNAVTKNLASDNSTTTQNVVSIPLHVNPTVFERLFVRVTFVLNNGRTGNWTEPLVCSCGEGFQKKNELSEKGVANSLECISCSPHAFCIAGLRPLTKGGYWSAPWESKNSGRTRYACPTPLSCVGPTSTSTLIEAYNSNDTTAWKDAGNESNQCAPLYTGPLCASCTREAYRDTLAITPQCLKCSDDQAASINFVVLMIVAVVVVIAVICYVAVTKISGKETAILKIAINSFAISSAVSQIPLAWSSSVLGMFQLYTVASVSAIGDAFAADCAVARTSDMRPVQAWALGMIMMPLGVVVLWFVAAVLANVGAKLRTFLKSKKRPKKTKSTNYLSTHLPGAVLVTLILAHQGVTKAAVELINCRTIAGRRFLEADVQIECTSNEYTTWANGVAVPMLIVYTIGFPLVYFVMLCTHVRAGIHEDKHHIYGYLLANFKTNAWWYEFWNVFRKALLSILVVTLNTSGTPVQSWGALLVLLVSVAVFAVARPYKEEYLNVLEATSLSVNIFTLMFGMGMYNGAFVAVQLNQASDTMGESTTETTESIVLSILILGINVIWIAKVLYDGFHSLLRNTLVFPAQSAQSAEQKKKSKHNKSSTGSNNKRKSGRKTNISLQKGTLSIAPILISLLILFPTTAYCSSCAKGQYTHPQNGGCSSCSPGMYNDQTSQRGCRSCNGGEFQNSYGATSCKKCSAGYYSVSNPLSGCSGGGDYTADYGTSRNALIGQLYRQILCRCADSAGRKFIYELHFVGYFCYSYCISNFVFSPYLKTPNNLFGRSQLSWSY